MAIPGISVEYGGVRVTNPLAQEQISTMVWACLRRERYVEGSMCRVLVGLSADGGYEIEAMAKEPTTAWLRLVDLNIPCDGIDPDEFTEFLKEQGLLAFATPSDGAVWFAGDPSQSEPEAVKIGGQHVGRNDLCPCGSGKKFKKCCLQ